MLMGSYGSLVTKMNNILSYRPVQVIIGVSQLVLMLSAFLVAASIVIALGGVALFLFSIGIDAFIKAVS